MADSTKIVLNGHYNKVERYGKVAKQYTNSNYSRKKNNSFSNFQDSTNSNNSLNYYSDTAASSSVPVNKKSKPKRSLSSSPVLHSHYAGAKFSEPPSANVVPLPPEHWCTESSSSAISTPRSSTPEDFQDFIPEKITSSTPLSRPVNIVNMNQSVELFFKKCSFNHLESCRDFTKSLKTLLNVPV